MSRNKLALVLLVVSFPLAAVSEYEKWLTETTEGYQNFKDERDKEFASYLKKSWKELRLQNGLVRDNSPKPIDVPIAEVPDNFDIPQKNKNPVDIDISMNKPGVEPYIEDTLKSNKNKGRKVSFQYLGQRLEYYYNPSIIKTLEKPISRNTLSAYWAAISNSEFEDVIEQLKESRETMGLNDWGYALLIDRFSKNLFHEKNDKTLFTWFSLVKSGYNARIAHNSEEIFLFLPSRQTVYDVDYIDMQGTRFYALSFNGEKIDVARVHTYDGNHPGAIKSLNLAIENDINIKRNEKTRKLGFEYNGNDYQISLSYDLNTVKFFDTYPQMEISSYFRSAVNSYTGYPLLEQLGEMVDGKDEVEAVNILLRFVQTSFDYATDKKQFGKENYLFPEETMHYTYSDCEDRSVLFSWLVRSLLDLDVIVLSYPGHLATAVKFSKSVEGDKVRYKGKSYTVADPTYINARAGMTMRDYQDLKPNVIEI